VCCSEERFEVENRISIGIERIEQSGEHLFYEFCVASPASCSSLEELLLE